MENARKENAAPNGRGGNGENGKRGINVQWWKRREQKTRHQSAGVEMVRTEKSGSNNALVSFHSAIGRRVKVAHPNLFTFLAHLQRTTTDNETEIQRLDRGLRIRRAKKRSNLVNDARIKVCINR